MSAVNTSSLGQGEKMSPVNLGTSAYQDKTVAFWKNPTGFVEKHLENNPSRIILCRFALHRMNIFKIDTKVQNNLLLEQCMSGKE
jgi:hypothetical protein